MTASGPPRSSGRQAIELSVFGMRKAFGPLVALDDVSIKVPAATFHALLGENGAGKSTLVKCVTGFYRPDAGKVTVDGREVAISNPRQAHAVGIGLVYQNFVLVPSLTGAENLVIARNDVRGVIHWGRERSRLADFFDHVPFRVPLDVPVARLAAGEKQKLEIIKQLYLDQRCLILDEPTSVLTPSEADEILGLLRDMAGRGEITVLMITHKFREVRAFADSVTVLRNGRHAGGGRVADLSNDAMARMMIGDIALPSRPVRQAHGRTPVAFEIAGVSADGDDGRVAIDNVNLKLHAGEIVGIAGVSGNGQSCPCRGPYRPAPTSRRPTSGGRQRVSADPRRHGAAQGFRPAGRTAEERRRAEDVGRREHGAEELRQAATVDRCRLAVARRRASSGA